MKTINHFGLSGGKDSTALWGWAINESGYDPSTIVGSFCDTGNEYQEVYDQIAVLDAYGQKHGVAPVKTLKPFYRVNGVWVAVDFLALAQAKKRFPSARARFCTEWLKMVPTRWYFEYFWLMGFDILAHSGVRAAESDERANLPARDKDSFFGIDVYRPLLTWTIAQVWDAHKRYGLPINPLYLKGRRRVGCKLCCMSNKNDVRQTVLHRPEVIDLYREWELSMVNRNMYSSFFASDTVPEAQRSREIITADGEKMKVCTIDDVARWSQTLRGGVQSGFDFMFEEDDDFDGGLTCRSAMGNCE